MRLKKFPTKRVCMRIKLLVAWVVVMLQREMFAVVITIVGAAATLFWGQNKQNPIFMLLQFFPSIFFWEVSGVNATTNKATNQQNKHAIISNKNNIAE